VSCRMVFRLKFTSHGPYSVPSNENLVQSPVNNWRIELNTRGAKPQYDSDSEICGVVPRQHQKDHFHILDAVSTLLTDSVRCYCKIKGQKLFVHNGNNLSSRSQSGRHYNMAAFDYRISHSTQLFDGLSRSSIREHFLPL